MVKWEREEGNMESGIGDERTEDRKGAGYLATGRWWGWRQWMESVLNHLQCQTLISLRGEDPLPTDQRISMIYILFKKR